MSNMAFANTSTPNAKLGDVYLMKFLCETIFRNAIIPKVTREKKKGEPPAS
jgi:hypothetical protein